MPKDEKNSIWADPDLTPEEQEERMQEAICLLDELDANAGTGKDSVIEAFRNRLIELTVRELRAARERGLSLRAIGRLSGVHYSDISRYGNGKARPSPPTCEKLLKALGKGIDVSLKDVQEGISAEL